MLPPAASLGATLPLRTPVAPGPRASATAAVGCAKRFTPGCAAALLPAAPPCRGGAAPLTSNEYAWSPWYVATTCGAQEESGSSGWGADSLSAIAEHGCKGAALK